jgi:Ca2+-binding RTX toxin-like protein
MATVYGSNNVDVINGFDGVTAFDDAIWGYGGNDTISGLGGDDHIKGGGGADTINGGAGVDTALYSDSTEGVSISLYAGDVGYGGTAEGDTLLSIENLIGSAYDDQLGGDAGNNTLSGANGSDTLWGYDGDDHLLGGVGNDHLDGGYGIDTMVGGTGNDTYRVDEASDVVTENAGQGIDVVEAYVSYQLAEGADVETLALANANGTDDLALAGNSSGNSIIGNNGDNVLKGGGGTDQLTGRGGNDIYWVDSMTDEIVESAGQGIDEVWTSADYTLTAGADVELLRTTSDAGVTAIDLIGNASGNAVRGNNGNNIIGGGDGNDELTGLGGHDSFLFDTALDAAANVDVITDFSAMDDTIRLENAVFTALGGGFLAANAFVVGAAALDASDRIIYNSATGALLYDSDGSGGGAAIQFAELATGLALTNLDFFVV